VSKRQNIRHRHAEADRVFVSRTPVCNPRPGRMRSLSKGLLKLRTQVSDADAKFNDLHTR